MIVREVWFESVDGNTEEFPAITLRGMEAERVMLPRVGEKVGIWQDDFTEGTNAYPLLFVVDVRHYLVRNEKGENKVNAQEIHVMCSAKI